MRKIPRELENPIDNILLNLCGDGMMDKLYQNGVTPNMITTVGNIVRAFSIYFLFKGHHLLFFILYLIGYYFDCLDGHFARKYNMCSDFGDLYDHVSDVIFGLIMIYYLFFVSSLRESEYFNKIVILFGILGFLMFIHFGCQQIYFGSTNEYLDSCQALCSSKDWLWWTRYFGSGTLIFTTAVLGYIF